MSEPLRAELLRAIWHGGVIASREHCDCWAENHGLTRAAFDAHVRALRDLGVVEESDDGHAVPVMVLDAEDAARRAYGQLAGLRTCRVCGCSDAWACDAGCWWVEADLCSACAEGVGA